MLLEHNVNVYNQLVHTLSRDNKVCVVMGTGVGKTYVTTEYLDNGNFKALVVCPRNSICEAWEKHTKRVETITYQKLANIYKDIDYSKYDLLIGDEIHHIGAPKWGTPFKYLIQNRIIPVIGLTESSVRYSDGGRDVADEFFDGNIVRGEDVKSAIEKKILNPVTYVGAMYNSDGLKKTLRGKIQSRLYAKLNLALNKTPTVMEIVKKNMPEGKRKGIIFASTIDDIKFAIDFMQSIYPKAVIKFVHSKQSDAINNETFEWFKNTDEGYLCSVDMISEGVHIKGVNTLVMLRRTESVNLFNQQLGRCLDASTREPAILFDLVNNKYSVKVVNNKLRIKLNSMFGSAALNVMPSEQLIVNDYTKDIIEVLKEIKESLSKNWTEEEDNLIREYYPDEGPDMYVRLPERTRHAVMDRAIVLNVSFKFYSEEEIRKVKELYFDQGLYASKVAEIMGLSKRAVNGIISRYFPDTKKAAGLWSEEDDELIKKYYPTEGYKMISRLSIKRTKAGLFGRAKFLGVAHEVVRNEPRMVKCVETGVIYPSMTEAAKALGLEKRTKTLRNNISRACYNGKSAYGFHWEIVK